MPRHGDARTNRGKTEGRNAAGSRHILKRLLAFAAAAFVISLTVFAVGILWKPRGAVREGPSSTFAAAVLESDVAGSALALLVREQAPLTVTEADIVDIGAAALDRNGAWRPPAVVDAVRDNVPDFVETVSGCRIRGHRLTLYIKCRRAVTFYVTIEGNLDAPGDGGLTYKVDAVRVGLFPVPLGSLAGEESLLNQTVVDPADADITVKSFVPADGSLTLELEWNEGGD